MTKPHYLEAGWYELSKVEVKSHYGDPVIACDPEKTSCGTWNSWYNAEDEIKAEAIRDYMELDRKNLRRLNGHRRILSIGKTVRSHIMVSN